MAHHGWRINLGLCIGCHSCYAACKSENNTPLRTDWRYVVMREGGTYPHPRREFISMACNHCLAPACQAACPTGSITKRGTDGVVLIDQDTCIGCRRCAGACPYGAPQVDTGTNKVSKCTLCVHRIDADLAPACATACLTGAITYVEDFTGQTTDKPEGFANPALTRPSVEFILQ